MGDQLYAYRDPYSSTNCDGGDKVCRTIIYDGDGRQRTVIGCNPGDYLDTTETTYVIETTEVKEKFRPVSDYHRYGSPPPPKTQTLTVKKAAEKYRRPREVDEFLTGVQIEASRIPPVGSAYGGSGGGYGTVNGKSEDRYYSKPQFRDSYRNGNNYGGAHYSSDDDDDSEVDDIDERYYYKPKVTSTMKPTQPAVSSPKAYGGGGGGWGSAPAASHGGIGKLGMPTSNIDEAVDNLRGTTRPYGASKFEVEPVKVKPYVGSTYNSGFGSDHAAPKPYGAKYEVAAKPVKPYVGSTYNSGYCSDHAAEKPYGAKYEVAPEPVKPYVGSTYNSGYGSDHAAAKPYGAKYEVAPEPVKPYSATYNSGFGSDHAASKPYGTKYELEPVKPNGATYNSGYGSDHAAAKPYGTAAKYGGTNSTTGSTTSSTSTATNSKVIDCYEAARKYNGKVIRT